MQIFKRFSLSSSIHPEEKKIFRLLFLHSFLLGFATSFYFVAANAYFLKKVSISNIPIAYIIAGTIGIFLMGFYRAIQKKAGVIASFVSSLTGFGIVCLLLYFFHANKNISAEWSLYIGYAGFILIFPFSVLFVVGFASVSLQLFNLAQSKRLSALIGTGEVIASIIGYLLVPLVLKISGNPNVLFIVAAVSIILSVIPIRKVLADNKEKFKSYTPTAARTPRNINWAFIKQEPFFVSIAFVTVFSVMAFYLSDYSYLISIRALSKLSGIEASVIISFLFSIIKAGELLFSMLSGNIISRKGMRFSLLILPFILMASSLFSFTANFVMDDVAFFLIAFFLLNKWSERVIRKGITLPAMKVLYQLAPSAERAQIQSAVEGTISQVSIVISGVVLLIITRSQPTDNPLHFLYVMSIVSVIAFSAWLLLVSNLYAKYRKKIQAYLHEIKPAKAQEINNNITLWLAENKLSKNEHELTGVAMAIKEIAASLQQLGQHQSEQLIGCYNPAIQTAIDNKDKNISKKIINAYFNNDNIFNRLLIIAHTQYLTKEDKQKFVYEMYELSDITLRLYLLKTFNSQGFAINNRFYFSNLCQSTIQELLWADATLEDIHILNNAELNAQIEAYQLQTKNILLELLKFLYDKQSIQVIQEVLNADDYHLENQIFAVELLDNIVTDELKQTIIPVFEPITIQAKKQRLQKHFPVYELPVEERLKEIVMKDYKLMNSYTKQLALQSYYQLTNDKHTLKAFNTSSIESLNAVAKELLNTGKNETYFKKQKVSDDLRISNYMLQNNLYYFLQYGLFIKENKRGSAVPKEKNTRYILPLTTIDNNRFEVDVLGLSLLMTL